MVHLPLHDIEQALKALANVNRLQLLFELQEPKGYADIDLSPSRDDAWGSGERSISRQAIRGHMEPLLDLGLVKEAPRSGKRGKAFIVDHGELFTLTEQLRQIATVQPKVEVDDGTMNLETPARAPDVDGPHLVLVRGVEEGRSFPLVDADPGDRWSIGRTRDAEIALDYDPYVSGDHAHVVRKEDGFFLVDHPDNKNGTFLNWARMTEGGVAPLSPGDVIGVGMSLLVFRR